MEENYYKYANLLLTRCLSIKKGQPLLISAPIESFEFIRILTTIATKKGINDIYFDWTDDVLKHQELLNYDNKHLEMSNFFNKSVYDEYAKKDAAFLMLFGDDPDIMSDVKSDKIAFIGKLFRTSRPLYKKRQLSYEIPWCIACVPTVGWAKKVLPTSNNPVKDLWNIIFDLCLVNTKDPVESWNKKTMKNKEICDKINELEISKLYYKNSKGTNFSIEFNKNIWLGGNEEAKDGRKIIVNMPTEEVFTTPNKYSANGIVYASKPLVYNNALINDFWIEFKNGKVVNCGALEGLKVLKSILEIKNGNYLGEVALVSNDSPISNSNLLFYETLYDENASCHLALGDGFRDTLNASDDELKDLGLNESDAHVDFMIGTSDMEIIADTKYGKKLIMKDGNIVL